jgi:hypothetical protein
MITLLVVLWSIAAFALVGLGYRGFKKWILTPWEAKVDAAIPEVPLTVQFSGGPLNGKLDLVRDLKPFLVTRYIPDNEEDRQVFGEIGGKVLFAPNLAYYTQIHGNEYLYVRDITEEEFYQMRETGEPPSARLFRTEEEG